MDTCHSPPMSPSRDNMAAALRASLLSVQLSRKSSKSSYTHPLYSARRVSYKDEDGLRSKFSSCSTSANSSAESLGVFEMSLPSPIANQGTRSRSTSTGSAQSSGSVRSATYADDFYPLITNIPSTRSSNPTLVAMAHAHNTMIRALNSCYNHVSGLTPNQIPDYLFYSQTVFNTVSQYLRILQDSTEPVLSAIHPKTFRSQSCLYRNPSFISSMHAWATYIHNPASALDSNFSAGLIQSYFTTFSPLLVQHLHDTVSILASALTSQYLTQAQLQSLWTRIDRAMADNLDHATDLVLLLGSQDRSFKIDGKAMTDDFPSLPLAMSTKIRKWYSRERREAWMFCSSDFSGRRRALPH